MLYTGINRNNLPVHEPMPGFKGRFVHTDELTIAYWQIEVGSVLPEHAHVHKQIVQMISGQLEMVIGGERHVYAAGDVVEIPSNVVHSGTALTDVEVYDIFLPTREDYRFDLAGLE